MKHDKTKKASSNRTAEVTSVNSLPGSPEDKVVESLRNLDLEGKHCKCALPADISQESHSINQILLTSGAIIGLDMEYCLTSYRQHAVNHSAALWRYYLLRQFQSLQAAALAHPESLTKNNQKSPSATNSDISAFAPSRRLSLQESWQQGRRSKSKTGSNAPPLAFAFTGSNRGDNPAAKIKTADFTISEEEEDSIGIPQPNSLEITPIGTRRRSTSALSQVETWEKSEIRLPDIMLIRSLSVMTNDSAQFGTASEGDWSERDDTCMSLHSRPSSRTAGSMAILSQSVPDSLKNLKSVPVSRIGSMSNLRASDPTVANNGTERKELRKLA